MHVIGIRREDKSKWECRVPLIPEHVQKLKTSHSIETVVQPSRIRVFTDQEYLRAGATVQEDLSACSTIFAIKEIPPSFFERGKTYVFFSHTIKGQAQNMPMLRKMLELQCRLIDYERIVDSEGNRLIAFGKYAGIAGMLDTLWAVGKRLDWKGVHNPFSHIKQAVEYADLDEARRDILRAGERIGREGFAAELTPVVCGITGYGNVSQGAQNVLDWLPVQELHAEELISSFKSRSLSEDRVYKVVFKEEDVVEPVRKTDGFELSDYYDNPERYRSRFDLYLPSLTILVNGIYWDERYPKLVTKRSLSKMYREEALRLRAICDISCDIGGSIESTVRHTDSGSPAYVYDPLADTAVDGCEGEGVLVLAVDNLPCELPRESSVYFSEILSDYVPGITAADFSRDFDTCGLPAPIRNGVITYNGELTPDYQYIMDYLGERR